MSPENQTRYPTSVLDPVSLLANGVERWLVIIADALDRTTAIMVLEKCAKINAINEDWSVIPVKRTNWRTDSCTSNGWTRRVQDLCSGEELGMAPNPTQGVYPDSMMASLDPSRMKSAQGYSTSCMGSMRDITSSENPMSERCCPFLQDTASAHNDPHQCLSEHAFADSQVDFIHEALYRWYEVHLYSRECHYQFRRCEFSLPPSHPGK